MDISVVIPARNEHPQIEFTLQTIFDQLERSSFDWEVILVDNMSTDATSSHAENRHWHKNGRLKIIRYNERGSCWQARNAGCEMARGEIVWLFDAHVVISEQLFFRQMEVFRARPECAIVYTPVRYMSDGAKNTAYGYSIEPQLRQKFWGSWTKRKERATPYRIPMSGTAGIAVRRSFLREIRGWPEPLMLYGGGEQWISLLCWMMGRECFIHPETHLYHYRGKRGYQGSNEEHFFNRAFVAYALGDVEWWRLFTGPFVRRVHKTYRQVFRDLAYRAMHEAEPYREWVQSVAPHSLTEVTKARPWVNQYAAVI